MGVVEWELSNITVRKMNELEQALPVAAADKAAPLPSTESVGSAERIRVIEPGKASLRYVVKDIWEHRELLYFLTWRDVKVRYKQTSLGVLWAVIQPVLSMVVLTIVFGRVSGIIGNTGTAPYPIFVYSGLLPWTFFATTLGTAGISVVSNSNLVTKVRFPRITLPLASVTAGMVDLAISFAVLLLLMIWFHVPFTWRLIFTPFLALGVAGMAFGFGAIFAALTVTYRDFRYVIPFMTQIWMFLTPVIYPVKSVPEKWRWLVGLNPLSGWIGAFRWVFIGQSVEGFQVGVSVIFTTLIVLLGMYYFRASERRFADVI
jgi:lipopolysaccharide transport system permease protein